MDEKKRVFKKPVDWDQLYPGRFLKSGEFMGKKVTLTIKDLDLDELEGEDGKKVKGVLTFEETARQIPLNKTNGICLKAMFGKKLAPWIGKKVTFFPGTWNGEDCIRVWGSPDIPKDFEVTVELSRRKPFKMTMHKMASGANDGSPAIPADDAEAAAALGVSEGTA